MSKGVRYVGCSVTEWHAIGDEEDDIYQEECSMKMEETWAALVVLNRETFEREARARAHRKA
eukprot:7956314-Pyramimonas_sp.AAC.1